MGVGAVWIVS